MTIAAIVTEVKDQIEAVTGIENVYEIRRRITDPKTLKEEFLTSDDVINGYWITVEGFGDVTVEMNEGATITWRLLIEGVYALDDKGESEKTFRNQVESIIARFRFRDDLEGVALQSGLMQGRIFEEVTFAGVLVHKVEMTLEVSERNRNP